MLLEETVQRKKGLLIVCVGGWDGGGMDYEGFREEMCLGRALRDE